jgi:hypothetical protein
MNELTVEQINEIKRYFELGNKHVRSFDFRDSDEFNEYRVLRDKYEGLALGDMLIEKVETLSSEKDVLQSQVSLLVGALTGINEQCETEFIRCGRCGDQEDLKNCDIHYSVKEALSTLPTSQLNRYKREQNVITTAEAFVAHFCQAGFDAIELGEQNPLKPFIAAVQAYQKGE